MINVCHNSRLLALCLLLTVALQLNGAPLKPEQFRESGEVRTFSLSPSGKFLAYTLREKKTDFVFIVDLDTNTQKYSFQMGKNNYIASFNWATNTRLLIEKSVVYKGFEHPYLIGHLQAVNVDGTSNTQLWGFKRDLHKGMDRELGRFFKIESLMVNDPEHIILSTYDDKDSTRRLVKLNINNGRTSLRERSLTERAQFVVDKTGEPVAQLGMLSDYTNELFYKDKSNKWLKLDNPNNHALIGLVGNDSILLEHFLGNNKTEIIKFNRLNKTKEIIATLNNTEVSDIFTLRNSGIISYDTFAVKPERHFLDANSDASKFHEGLKNAFKGKYAAVETQSLDGSRKIISVKSDIEPGMHLLFKDGKLSLFNKRFPDLDRKQFSNVMPISFQSRDDLTINGYLTIPKGAKSPFPTVVIVHGGPFGIRDYWEFNETNQLLASQGYAVLQINFRGSGGYGNEFKVAGRKQWGLSMQNDITDGTQWAIDNGFADKERICIYGGSYGGYAALTGVFKEPDLYKCAIGSAGLYDLPMWYKKGDVKDSTRGVAYIEKYVGTDMKILKENSPVNNVHKMKAALMLVHGTDDIRVPFEHYEKLTEALDKINYPYESIVFKDEGHGYFNKDNNLKFNSEMLKFFKKHLSK